MSNSMTYGTYLTVPELDILAVCETLAAVLDGKTHVRHTSGRKAASP